MSLFFFIFLLFVFFAFLCIFVFILFGMEENVFMEFLSYMYGGKLTMIEFIFLFDILMVADKFGVFLCMSYCSRLFMSLFMMIMEFVLFYMDYFCLVLLVSEV